MQRNEFRGIFLVMCASSSPFENGKRTYPTSRQNMESCASLVDQILSVQSSARFIRNSGHAAGGSESSALYSSWIRAVRRRRRFRVITNAKNKCDHFNIIRDDAFGLQLDVCMLKCTGPADSRTYPLQRMCPGTPRHWMDVTVNPENCWGCQRKLATIVARREHLFLAWTIFSSSLTISTIKDTH